MDQPTPPADSAEQSPGQVIGLFHGGVTVADLDRSVAFYCDVLGFVLAVRRDATEEYLRQMHRQPFTIVRMAFLAIPNSTSMIELIQYLGVETRRPAYQPSDPATGHLCFLVDDIHALDRRLRAIGCPARSDHPIQITAGPNKGGWAVYFADPDGYPLEFIQRVRG